MATQPVLEISTTQKRVPVRIDGKAYSLRTVYDLGFQELQQTERDGAQIAALLEKSGHTLTKAQTQDLTVLLRRLCKATLVAPPKVHSALNLINLLTLYRVFAGHFAADVGVLLAQGAVATPDSSNGSAKTR